MGTKRATVRNAGGKVLVFHTDITDEQAIAAFSKWLLSNWLNTAFG